MGGADFADQFAVDRPGVPVLFMSGYADHLGRREEMGAGYLQKPFTAASLLTQVRAVLDAV
jgi:FixJ family two-component response regulator